MTVREALQTGSARLKNFETPYLDAGLLLASVMGISREKLLASYPDVLQEKDYASYEKLISRRITGIPVSYILNRKEFFGRTFYVDERVLVPRPDTEVLVETALTVVEEFRKVGRVYKSPVRIIDVCTGTGCIPITMALELAEETGTETKGAGNRKEDLSFEYFASELSEEAMEVFRINHKRLCAVPVTLIQSDLLAAVPGTFDIITSNPPYLTAVETDTMMESGWPEPALALDGGDDGLDLVRRLISQSLTSLNPGGWLIMEAAWNQMETIEKLMIDAGFTDTVIYQDLGARNRVVKGKLTT